MTLIEELEIMNKINRNTNELSRVTMVRLHNLFQLMSDYEVNRLLTLPHYQDPKRLEKFGFPVFSQNDEDGIIHEIFNRIGVTNKCFVEFGVGNGLENNTHYLLFQGWRGLWIEGNEKHYQSICNIFREPIKDNHLIVKNDFIYKENINDLIKECFEGEIDLLSVDIDGNDYHVLDTITVISPRVIVIEYNSKFPPYINWCMKYDPNHTWDASDKQGASLKALELLGKKKGYQLVGTNLNGVNAFFVREDLAKNLFFEPATAENLYNTFKRIGFANQHYSKHFLGYCES